LAENDATSGGEGGVPLGELFPRAGFIVTNLTPPSRAVVWFYDKRGTAEQWIKEAKQAVKMTRLSCHRFRSDEVRRWLSLLAYNLGKLWQRLVLPTKRNWQTRQTSDAIFGVLHYPASGWRSGLW